MAETSTSGIPVLVFAPFGKDAVLIERVLSQSAVTIRSVGTLQELAGAICEDVGAAIIAEEVLQNGGINALAQRISAQPPWSDFAVIVLTGSGLTTAQHRIGGALACSFGQCDTARTAPTPGDSDQRGPQRIARSPQAI